MSPCLKMVGHGAVASYEPSKVLSLSSSFVDEMIMETQVGLTSPGLCPAPGKRD